MGEVGGNTSKRSDGMNDDDRKLIKDISRFFSTADSDKDGTLSILEFFQYQKAQIKRQKEAEDKRWKSRDVYEERLARIEEKLDALTTALMARK